MPKILVTSDFSECSKSGIRFALQLADQTGMNLEFFHVVEITKPTSWTTKRYKFLEQERLKKSVSRLKLFVSDIAGKNLSEHPKITFTAQSGLNASALINTYARKIKANYICLSSRGAGKLRKLFGNHSSALLTTSRIPVIIVPKGYRARPLKTLLFATDFQKLSKEVRTVKDFAQLLDARVEAYHFDYLIHVSENLKKLEAKASRYTTPEFSFHFKRLEIDISLAEHLKKHIQKVRPQLVIMFTKQNRNWFDRIFITSKSIDTAFHSKYPLLVFRK